MKQTIAKSFCVELTPVHLKQDGKLSPSVVLAKFGTKKRYRTITKDMWYKLHPSPYCRSRIRFYQCAAIPVFASDDGYDGYDT